MPTIAWADKDEMTVAFGVTGGSLWPTDPVAAERGAAQAVVGVSVRMTYATSDWFRYEVMVGSNTARTARFANVEVEGLRGDLTRRQLAVRGLAGVTATLGVRWIPTLSLFAGAERSQFHKSQLRSDDVVVARLGSPRGDTVFLLGVGGGLAHRFGRRWALGGRVQGFLDPLSRNRRSSIEGTLFLEYHFYP